MSNWLKRLERWYDRRHLARLQKRCQHPLIWGQERPYPRANDPGNHPFTNVAMGGYSEVTRECEECGKMWREIRPTNLPAGEANEWIEITRADRAPHPSQIDAERDR